MLGSAPGFDGRGIALGQGNSFCVFACAVELTNLGVECVRLRVHERKVGDGYGDEQAAGERQTSSSTFPHGLAFRSTQGPRLMARRCGGAAARAAGKTKFFKRR